MKIIERRDIQIEVNKSQINQINKGTLYIHTNYRLSRFFKMDGYKSSETYIEIHSLQLINQKIQKYFSIVSKA